MDKLNLGCGRFKKKGFLNADIDPRVNPDILMNLNKFPYPFLSNQFVHIEADHVLEHLQDPFLVMKELHRILKPGGTAIIRVPHSSRGFTHPDHKRGFDVSFPLYFNKNYEAFYYGIPFNLQSMKLKWFAQPYMKKKALKSHHYYLGLLAGSIVNLFANSSPYFCSRIWCYWVGGFEEIEFIFKKDNGEN